jgi:HAE1 family hydrophobic/amphiphilic exporter-1
VVHKPAASGGGNPHTSDSPKPVFQDWTTGAIPKVRGRRAAD